MQLWQYCVYKHIHIRLQQYMQDNYGLKKCTHNENKESTVNKESTGRI